MITQEDLSKFKKGQEVLRQAAQKVKMKQAEVDDLETKILVAVKAGDRVEKGSLVPDVEVSLGKASIKWKDEVIKVKGAAYAEKLLQGAPRPTVEKLVVKEVL